MFPIYKESLVFVTILIQAYFTAVLCSSSSVALPLNHTDSSVNAAISAGTFQNPSVNIRPRFRYWLPDASVDPQQLADDIKEAGQIGAGGVEFLPYYLYGGLNNQSTANPDPSSFQFTPVDWSTYGFGTEDFRNIFKIAAQAHKDNGLIMDMALTANQGQGVPSPVGAAGLMHDLFVFNITVRPGDSFKGTLPGFGKGQLVAATTGMITSKMIIPALSNSTIQVTRATIAHDTLQDITNQVGADGSVSLTFPNNSSAVEFTIWAAYVGPSNYRTVRPGNDPQNFIQNGSWAVDHFSALGAQTTIDFLENHVLIDGNKELFMDVGNYVWEDSIEIRSNVYWTQTFPQQFLKARNYSINDYIGLLTYNNSKYSTPGQRLFWVTDEKDQGQSHIDDYRTTLAELYGVYLQTLNDWAHDFLNVQFSCQVSYNLPMDMLKNIPLVDAPECESLAFNHQVDSYRQYVGPANLAGKRVISSELGANIQEAYQQTLPELLWDVKRSFAGGVNQFVFHGYPYSGTYPNSTWPGYTTFMYRFAQMHQRHQPAWAYYPDSINWVARMQFIEQSGVPKRDVVFWQKDTATNPNAAPNYRSLDLIQAGYTYEYISPDDLDLPQAQVQNGVLAADGPAYKAMIIRANDSLTVDGVQRLANLAHNGLPIVFVGGLPSRLAGFNHTGATFVQEVLASLTSLENVHTISFSDSLPATLDSIGIVPATKVSSNGTWYTYWRHDEKAQADYVYIYNDSPFSEGTIEFASTGIPYTFDAWTGDQHPILNYSTTESTTSIFFQLAGNQTTLVAFTSQPLANVTTPPQNDHVTFSGTDVLGFSYSDQEGVIAKSAGQDVELKNWSLVVERWDPPANLFDIDTIAVKSVQQFTVPNLISWLLIPGLEDVSGTGRYSTSFNWSESSFDGAIIDFGAIIHSIRVAVNDQSLPPLDLTWARADITPYLKPGENLIEVNVSTPLYNRLRPIWGELETAAVNPLGVLNPAQNYGLIGEAVVKPYKSVKVDYV